ncbi:MAG: ComEA family DNA-binding protein [Planctomycetota bacterium]
MPHPSRTCWEVNWRPEHLPALMTLMGLAMVALAAQAVHRSVPLGDPPAIFPERIAVARDRINPNTASKASLIRLSGIGPAKAGAIVHHRRTHPPFRKPDDLQAVHGIGPILARRMAQHLTLRPGP